ncbi:hypothetical protein ACFPC0_20410 [Streptomyces andamanensis]|uniref:Uncharacterized protein n=1 Tax=Streptomyces andamanensis TaxID=1565035 RepID=A0ABV8THK3_9ACTN
MPETDAHAGDTSGTRPRQDPQGSWRSLLEPEYRERAFNLQQTSDAIEQHVTAYDLAIPPYNQQDEAANLEKLAENVEMLRVEQRKRQQLLEHQSRKARGHLTDDEGILIGLCAVGRGPSTPQL